MTIFDSVKIFLDDEEIPFVGEVHARVFKEDGVVVYAGSASNVEHAVLLGTNLVFFDTHLVEDNISEIIRKIEKMGRLMNVSSSGKKTIIDFRIEKTDFSLTYYAEDATKIGIEHYPELENGIYTYFVKVPFPKETRAGSLRDPEFFWRILDMIVIGGFYLERECPLSFKISSERLGFEKVASGHISALSVHPSKGNLYKKVKKVENLRELVHEDFNSSFKNLSDQRRFMTGKDSVPSGHG